MTGPAAHLAAHRAARWAARRARRRRIGRGLVAFGVAGLFLSGAAAVLVLGSMSAVDDAATGFERQRAELLAMLGPASDALERAADSASNAGASLTETREAAGSAAQLTTRLAESFESLATLGALEIFGSRPFGPAAEQFAAVAVEARTLSGHLQATAAAIDSNVADSAAVADSLRALSTQLGRLEASLGGPAAGPGASPDASPSVTSEGSVGPLSSSFAVRAALLVVLGMLAWVAVAAAACVWLGWRWAHLASG